jgi:hypothetical protein
MLTIPRSRSRSSNDALIKALGVGGVLLGLITVILIQVGGLA